ncbi:MAG TPA: helical backbone metal receptor, partial [Taishania sp.]|nr:helical backbone metal receptor [Taishania sp.]
MEFKDQMNQIVRLETVPRRIISLVPSQTELLHDIGLEEEVVGITKFCIFPERWFHTKNRVGGPKKLDIEKIKALQPDLILANKEENIESEINELKQFVPVWVSDIETLQQANEMILTVGEMVGKSAESQKIVREI